MDREIKEHQQQKHRKNKIGKSNGTIIEVIMLVKDSSVTTVNSISILMQLFISLYSFFLKKCDNNFFSYFLALS